METAETRHVLLALDSAQEYIEKILGKTAQRLRNAPVSEEKRVQVKVNHGRWVIECNACGLSSFACSRDKRFFCPRCKNSDVGGMWKQVVWPFKEDVRRIETVLSRRKEENRNWEFGETIADLERENRENGLDCS